MSVRRHNEGTIPLPHIDEVYGHLARHGHPPCTYTNKEGETQHSDNVAICQETR